MIRLIASDIDGTLIPEGKMSVEDPEIFRQIIRLKDKGIIFCPASGRQYNSMRLLFGPVGGDIPYMCENGAVIFGPGNPGPLLSKTAMDRDTSIELCREILDDPDCELAVSGANTCYLFSGNPDFCDYMSARLRYRTKILKSPSEIPEDIVKISAHCDNGPEGALSRLAPKWDKHFSTALAGNNWLDFTLADKGSGLLALCAALGIDPGEVMAFGDNFNDLPMLLTAGHPYIKESADSELLKIIPDHCTSVTGILSGL